METILVAVIFSIPGIISNRILFRVFPKSIGERTEYEKTITAIIDSIFVLILNIVVLNLFLNKDIKTFENLLTRLSYMSFFIKYSVLTLFNCFILSAIKRFLYNPLVLKVINLYKNNKGGIQENIWPSAWEYIFENPEISKKDMYITIEKNGEVITAGLVDVYPPPNQKNRDILLRDTQGFKLYLDNDKNIPEDKRLLDIIKYEYYDFNNDLLIKIYDNTKLIAYLNEP